MIEILILLIELIGLYLLAQLTTRKLFSFFLLIFNRRTIAVTVMTLFLFPGTVIHELAHLFVAEILGVHTGKLTLVPENIREEEIQTGSVTIVQTDPFRRAIVGLAPFLVGLTAIVILSYFVQSSLPITNNQQLITILLFYLLFAVASSMFPSSPDLKGTPALLLTIALFVLAGYVVGIRIGLTGQVYTLINNITRSLIDSLKFVLAVDVIILLTTQLLVFLTVKITGRKIVS